MSAHDADRPVLQVVVGSTRPGRVALPVAQWVHERAAAHGGFTAELIDLAEVGLPLFDEPYHPRLRRYVHDHTKRWSATVERADAFVFVHPEYNHSMTAVLKNAIDYLHQEWAYKPVGLVGYGGVAAGARAMQALKPVCSVLKLVPLAETVPIPFVTQFITGEGDDRRFEPNTEVEAGAQKMLDELVRWVPTLRPLRNAQ